ncbi:spartin a isoform X2 [Latimeria chalumnae]|uniref:Spartin n=2 Tax=Latimeria chalumnae TaxID=7897 RepID=H3A8R8_LATCH|nr:PREDICTED: spartin isoform X2 [Latimeria chalumnae]|eukprot:XP_006010272.1 PREDICTED: spartin isoform X2 [Latimeria chalumnae]
MEPETQPTKCEDSRAEAIKQEYKKAFTFINKGLNADEGGPKSEAESLYRQGQEHLVRGLSIPSQGPECTGPQWDLARQMQQKMQETLSNISTRLSVLEQEELPMQSSAGRANSCTLPQNQLERPPLYPALPPKEKPERPLPPSSLLPKAHPSAANVNPSARSSVPLPAVSPITPSSHCVPNEQPPAYTPQAADGHFTISYGTDHGEFALVGDGFSTRSSQPPPLENLGEDAVELLLIPQGVQIFYVTYDGQVSAPSYPGYLRIVKFSDSSSGAAQNRPPAFLQVCDWLYPLVFNQSPALICNTGVYMFPDVMSQVPWSYVGVVLSSEIPNADRELFEELLKKMTDLRAQDAEASSDALNLSQKIPVQPGHEAGETEKVLPQWSEKVASGILTGASWLSWGLVKGAEYTGKAIQKGATKLREHVQPEDKPLVVSPTVAKGLHVAKQASGGAVKVSQFLVDGVCTVAGCVGRELAPHVKKHGSKLIPESLKKDKEGKSTVEGAMVVAASGMQGFATVWQGLESAARCLANSVASETVQTVKHKYGTDAGKATDYAVNSAINVGVTAFNIDNLGIKAVVKRTAKETGHAILQDYNIVKEKPDKNEGP